MEGCVVRFVSLPYWHRVSLSEFYYVVLNVVTLYENIVINIVVNNVKTMLLNYNKYGRNVVLNYDIIETLY